MREILFKAKRKNWRELTEEEWWVKGYILKCASHSYMIPFTYEIDCNERTNHLVGYAFEIESETISVSRARTVNEILNVELLTDAF